jgi:hypothetical protein
LYGEECLMFIYVEECLLFINSSQESYLFNVRLNLTECWPLTHPLTLQPDPMELKRGRCKKPNDRSDRVGYPMELKHGRCKVRSTTIDPIGSDIMSRKSGPNWSLQNRLVWWEIPPFYKLFSKILSIRCRTKSHCVIR